MLSVGERSEGTIGDSRVGDDENVRRRQTKRWSEQEEEGGGSWTAEWAGGRTADVLRARRVPCDVGTFRRAGQMPVCAKFCLFLHEYRWMSPH